MSKNQERREEEIEESKQGLGVYQRLADRFGCGCGFLSSIRNQALERDTGVISGMGTGVVRPEEEQVGI